MSFDPSISIRLWSERHTKKTRNFIIWLKKRTFRFVGDVKIGNARLMTWRRVIDREDLIKDIYRAASKVHADACDMDEDKIILNKARSQYVAN